MQKNKESTGYIFTVAIILCLVCATLVSIAAVSLKSIQDQNAAKEKMVNILQAADVYDASQNVVEQYKSKISSEIIDLKTGDKIDGDPNNFDALKASKDPKESQALEKADDPAGINRQAYHQVVYFLKEDGEVKKIILPIHGYGLWGTMYGFLALSSDAKTVQGITFYEHKETPGLGGEITNPKWQAGWVDKSIYKDGQPHISLVKGGQNKNPDINQYQVDSLAGATLTSRGVQRTVNFWLGDHGFGPFLKKFINK